MLRMARSSGASSTTGSFRHLRVQEDIASKFLRSCEKTDWEEKKRLTSGTPRTASYQLYLKAATTEQETEEGIKKGSNTFSRRVRTKLGHRYAGADSYTCLEHSVPPRSTTQEQGSDEEGRARHARRRVIPRWHMSNCIMNGRRGGEREYKEHCAHPNYTTDHHGMGVFRVMGGDEAMAEVNAPESLIRYRPSSYKCRVIFGSRAVRPADRAMTRDAEMMELAPGLHPPGGLSTRGC